MADRTARLRVVVDSDTKGADKASASLEKIDGEAARAGKSLATMGDDANGTSGSLKKLGDTSKETTREVRTHADAVKVLREEYKQTQARIRELNVDLLRRGGSDSGILKRLRAERSELRNLTRIGSELGIDIGKAMADGAGKTFLSSLQGGLSTPVLGPAIAGAIGGLVTVIGPGLGALLGGTITGALGTGAMAAGILTAAHDSRVQAAAKEFGDSVTGEFFSGTAFIEPVIAGLDILKREFKNLGLDDLLAPLAPTVITIAHGIADFVNHLKDAGLAATFARMDQFAHIAAEGLASAGDALGFFFDEVSKDKGSMDGLRAFFAILNGTVRISAVVINFLEEVFHRFSITLAGVAGIANKISFGHLDEFQRGAEAILGVAPDVSQTLGQLRTTAGDTFGPFNQYLKEARERTEALTMSLSDLVDQSMAAGNANIAFEQAVDDLTESFDKNGRTLDINTQKGRDNMRALNDAIVDAARARDEMAKTQGLEAANRAFNDMLQRLYAIGVAAGISKEQLDKLVNNPYRVLVTYQVSGSASGAGAHARYLVEGGTADILGGQRAAGGPVRAGVPYLVGEKRPEVFVPGSNGYVFPDVPRAGGGSAGNSAAQSARPFVYGGSNQFEAFLIEQIRTAVAARGGTLAVLGLRAA